MEPNKPVSRPKSNGKKQNNPNADESEVDRQISIFLKKIDVEKERITNLNEQICATEAESLEQKRRAGGSDADNKERQNMIEKQIRMMEDRLNQALVAFNTKVAENKELRKEIDEMRQERCRYDEIYTQLEYQCQEHAQAMEDALMRGKKQIRMRDKALHELNALEKQFELETIKISQEQEELRSLGDQFQKDEAAQTQRPVSENNKRRASIASKLACNNTDLEDDCDELEFDDSKVLDEALAKVIELTGIGTKDVDALIERMTNMEDRSFSRFSYITHELENELAVLDTKIIDQQHTLEKLKCRGLNDGMHRQRELDKMEETKVALQSRLAETMANLDEEKKKFEEAKSAIQLCSQSLSLCKPDSLTTDEITENNMMEYLAEIEKKTTGLMCAMNEEDDPDNDPIILHGALLTSPSKQPHEKSQLDFLDTQSDTDDDGERPLTIEEIRKDTRRKKRSPIYP